MQPRFSELFGRKMVETAGDSQVDCPSGKVVVVRVVKCVRPS
jgi:hypothetical protein